MKKYIVCLFLVISCVASSFANLPNVEVTNQEKDNSLNTEIQNSNSIVQEIKFLNDCCLIRACWLEGTKKVCTEWQEVPCDAKIKVVGAQAE